MYKINPGFDCILESKFKDKLHRDGYMSITPPKGRGL